MPVTVGFLGLPPPSRDMARRLLRDSHPQEYLVKAFDGYECRAASANNLSAIGGRDGPSSRDVVAGSDFLICAADCSGDIEQDVFSKSTDSLLALPQHAVVVFLGVTVQRIHFDRLSQVLADAGRSDILVANCVAFNEMDGVTLLVTGSEDALCRTDTVLRGSSDKLLAFPGKPADASDAYLVYRLLLGSHTAAAAEAIGLAARAGLNTQQVYNIIRNAAGSSRAFETCVPSMLQGDWSVKTSSLDACAGQMAPVVSAARAANFSLPLGGAAEQLFISGCAQGYGLEDVSGLVRLYLPTTPDLVKDCAKSVNLKEALTPGGSPLDISKIGVIGLGAMGQGMATSLTRAGFPVHGYDVFPQAMDRFAASGPNAKAAGSPAEALRDADVVILMVQNASQVDEVLFGPDNNADSLSDGAVIILSSTVPPSFVRELDTKLRALGRGIWLVDAPVSGGVARAANGTLTIICSGEDLVLAKVNSVLLAMTGTASNLCHVEGGIGAASSVKLVNQLLAGVHIAAAAEAMAFAARLGIDTRSMFEVVKSSGAWSWMFENRVPQMLEADWTPHSALAIFVKDLGIVLDEAKRLQYYAPIASAAHNLYLSGASRGWTKESDAGVVRLWELPGSSVAEMAASKPDHPKLGEKASVVKQGSTPTLPAAATLDALPAAYGQDVIGSVRQVVDSREVPMLVVLDDDPTGTQTCHDIDVLTVWDPETLDAEFSLNPGGFFILTNSRALPSAEARSLIVDICKNVSTAANKANKKVEIVLRGDSTLRGHLPEEPEAAEEALGLFDGWVITPFFSQGGRLTIDDVHYVKEGDKLVPASQTPFAQDATFGYKNANLRQYVLEKCGSRFNDSSFLSVTLDDVRNGGPAAVTKKLLSVPADPNRVIIVNAVVDQDMHVFVAGLLEAERSGRRYLFRTGAAFVSSRLGITGIPPLTMASLGVTAGVGAPGGLIIAGSYVPKTTAQLEALKRRRGDKLVSIELDVERLISSTAEADSVVEAAADEASRNIAAGKDTLIMTSRSLIKGHDGDSSLNIGSKVARALVQLVEKIHVRPRYMIAKGGITSSDAATKALRMRRARVLGQAAPGVPLWRCDEETSRHRGMPYVVFPGNVGSDTTLAEVVEAWAIDG
ncbi:MFS quinate transporter [Purpureocillium lavendulum]|uniref:MFS quinate transporter n=1 Tax=Purpureocillium lavendulum TaxID=1247861 RepID=A0AB34FPL9_9HYPO|nr:MFS quinate transporter [Purpureocillium lavendulum]